MFPKRHSPHALPLQLQQSPKTDFVQFIDTVGQETEGSIALSQDGDGMTSKPDIVDSSSLDNHELHDSFLNDEHKKLMEAMQSMGMESTGEIDGFDMAEWIKRNMTPGGNENMSLVGGQAEDPADVSDDDALSDMIESQAFEDEQAYRIEELKSVLIGMPDRRIKKVAEAFRKNLGYPSMLQLIPILRENMPERVTLEWLKRKNVQNAFFVVEKAKDAGLADVHMLNGMLQVECGTGSIDRALACHDARFKLYGLVPNEYSDRLVLQMLIKNKRLSRALRFKETVEESGRKLDILSYGSLIEHYAKHRQIGSALMMLKECVAVHDSPPAEYSLNALRRLCRHQHLTEKVGLVELAGPDPLQWLREGEATLKREYSKKGRRDVKLVRDKAVHI